MQTYVNMFELDIKKTKYDIVKQGRTRRRHPTGDKTICPAVVYGVPVDTQVWVSPGEEGGEGKAVRKRRWRAALSGAQMEAEQVLLPALRCPSVLPEGSFRSRGSSKDSMAPRGLSPD